MSTSSEGLDASYTSSGDSEEVSSSFQDSSATHGSSEDLDETSSSSGELDNISPEGRTDEVGIALGRVSKVFDALLKACGATDGSGPVSGDHTQKVILRQIQKCAICIFNYASSLDRLFRELRRKKYGSTMILGAVVGLHYLTMVLYLLIYLMTVIKYLLILVLLARAQPVIEPWIEKHLKSGTPEDKGEVKLESRITITSEVEADGTWTISIPEQTNGAGELTMLIPIGSGLTAGFPIHLAIPGNFPSGADSDVGES